ncbi:MAG: OmpA family protein [Candidatus Adiutrix sp.]|jgi:flagellar motor protein MotB|nr:OmpA family protein [Candidatus Adiutrix sp.]
MAKKLSIALAALAAIGIFIWLLAAEKGRSADLTRELAETRRQHFQTVDDLTRAQEFQNTQKREIDSLTERNRQLEDKARAAENRISQLEIAVSGTERLLTAAREETDSLRREAGEATRRAAEADEKLREAETRLETTEARLREEAEAACPEAVCPARADSQEADAAREKALAEAARLKLEVTRTEAELTALRQQLGRDHDRVAEMKRELALLAGEKETAQTEAKTAREAYDQITHDLKSLVGSQELVISELQNKLSLTFMDKIFFAVGSATLTADGTRVLETVAASLKGLDDRKIMVVGHTDDQPIAKRYQRVFPSNWELSAARAGAVIRFFQEKGGLSPDSLEAVGRAFYDPVAPNDSPENRQKNRRVEIVVTSK